METWNTVLGGLLAAWSTVLGGLLAAGLGLAAFFVQERYRRKAEKRKVANALMNEMLHALKFLAAGHKVLIRISKRSGSASVSKISSTYPSRRAIYVSVGPSIGVLSERAAEAAVNFDHYIQSLERDFGFMVGEISPASNIDPETALKLANKIATTIKCTTEMVECMADEVGGNGLEATKKKIRDLKLLVENEIG